LGLQLENLQSGNHAVDPFYIFENVLEAPTNENLENIFFNVGAGKTDC
jgi:hypothetical protein